ncbi:MAG: hypothetical protein Q7S00_02175, partial [bacterium]|nr:hypothetical protein [bacterium]
PVEGQDLDAVLREVLTARIDTSKGPVDLDEENPFDWWRLKRDENPVFLVERFESGTYKDVAGEYEAKGREAFVIIDYGDGRTELQFLGEGYLTRARNPVGEGDLRDQVKTGGFEEAGASTDPDREVIRERLREILPPLYQKMRNTSEFDLMNRLLFSEDRAEVGYAIHMLTTGALPSAITERQIDRLTELSRLEDPYYNKILQRLAKKIRSFGMNGEARWKNLLMALNAVEESSGRGGGSDGSNEGEGGASSGTAGGSGSVFGGLGQSFKALPFEIDAGVEAVLGVSEGPQVFFLPATEPFSPIFPGGDAFYPLENLERNPLRPFGEPAPLLLRSGTMALGR